MAEVLLPIIIDGDGFFDVYPSISAAREWLEATDVNDDLYEVFDASGRRFTLSTQGDVVFLAMAPDSRPDPDQLLWRARNSPEVVGQVQLGFNGFQEMPLPAILDWLLSRQLPQKSDRQSTSVKRFLPMFKTRSKSLQKSETDCD
jgi:hypothetical protein